MPAPALAAAAQAAGRALTNPRVQAAAADLLKRATGGRLSVASTSADIAAFAAKRPANLAVVSEVAVRAGVPVDALLDQAVIGTDPELLRIRGAMMAIGDKLKANIIAHNTDSPTSIAPLDAAKLAVAMRQVRVIESIFGSTENYFLCQGLTPDAVAAVKTVRAAGR